MTRFLLNGLFALLLIVPTSAALADTASDFQKAIKAGDLAAVEEILASGFDVDTPITGSKSTGLIVSAAHPENIEITKLLLKSGADVNYRNKKGKSALDYAKSKKAQEWIDVLMEAGAK